jgi:hypothetical protein
VLDRLPPTDEVSRPSQLTGVVAHAAEDLTITVRAGTPSRSCREVLAAHGQECPIEPTAGHGSTVGGRIATALAGPRQLGAGRVRDWVLRVRFVTGPGRSVTAGGVTVKDVTGYDLCRLMTGSWGTLGVHHRGDAEAPTDPRTAAGSRPTGRPRPRPAATGRPPGHHARRGPTSCSRAPRRRGRAGRARRAAARPTADVPTTARAAVDPAGSPELTAGLARSRGATPPSGRVGVCHLDGDAEALAAGGRAAERLGGRLLVLDPDRPAAFGGTPSRWRSGSAPPSTPTACWPLPMMDPCHADDAATPMSIFDADQLAAVRAVRVLPVVVPDLRGHPPRGARPARPDPRHAPGRQR